MTFWFPITFKAIYVYSRGIQSGRVKSVGGVTRFDRWTKHTCIERKRFDLHQKEEALPSETYEDKHSDSKRLWNVSGGFRAKLSSLQSAKMFRLLNLFWRQSRCVRSLPSLRHGSLMLSLFPCLYLDNFTGHRADPAVSAFPQNPSASTCNHF